MPAEEACIKLACRCVSAHIIVACLFISKSTTHTTPSTNHKTAQLHIYMHQPRHQQVTLYGPSTSNSMLIWLLVS
jgi:hypothetical protein